MEARSCMGSVRISPRGYAGGLKALFCYIITSLCKYIGMGLYGKLFNVVLVDTIQPLLDYEQVTRLRTKITRVLLFIVLECDASLLCCCTGLRELRANFVQ